MNLSKYDVVVLGGGPAGSVAARQSALSGLTTLLVEKAEFPRFHIGESLLPHMMAILEQLGLLEALRAEGHPVKRGAEFCDSSGRDFRVGFDLQGPGRHHSAVQVERARFDKLLFDSASAAGAEVVSPVESADVELAEGDADHRVTVRLPGGEQVGVAARVVIDATGRAGLIAKKLKLRHRVERLNNIALFRHFHGVDEADNPGVRGDIQVGLHPDGWVWAIPISEDVLSIGTVMHRTTLGRGRSYQEVFDRFRVRVPRITQRLGAATATGPVRMEVDFAYFAEHAAGNRWFLAGDAAAFVDPVFSGGVYLGIATGRQAALEAARVLSGETPVAVAGARYDSFYKTGYDTYFRLVQSFYEHKFDFWAFMDTFGDIVDDEAASLMLSGDLWREENVFAKRLRTIDRLAVFPPFELYTGCPAYPGV
ncbi:NAD(P)/FAD-dependent oxidoreductase [Actinosynnema sp. NPDC050436]|uniref:NAD(P)/FAD-dependent oxidoreductase n=1 Tax=Actinosynnema sp. NPDC050436 TaxID=3155659 RepID=UPI0033FE3374